MKKMIISHKAHYFVDKTHSFIKKLTFGTRNYNAVVIEEDIKV